VRLKSNLRYIYQTCCSDSSTLPRIEGVIHGILLKREFDTVRWRRMGIVIGARLRRTGMLAHPLRTAEQKILL
jgi:hypothetical protein